MVTKVKTASWSATRLWAGFRGQRPGHDGTEQPLRAELFSAEQMVQHGKLLAASHQLKPGHPRDRLLKRLAENESLLLQVHHMLTSDVKADRRIAPAGEWLLDNYYVIEEQIRTANRHFPKGYSRELPRLRNGPSAGLPRVYDIALETISRSDGQVDPEILAGFVTAYQSVSQLNLGELWAIPIMLRLALIENLRRIAGRIAADRVERNRAEFWADQMTKVAEQESNSLILTIADMVRSNPPMVSSFVAELTRRLHGRGSALVLPLTWIEQRLSESGQTIEQLVRWENQQQAADQVSTSNSIGSLRFLGAMDWRKFVETMSVVEATLSEDPGDVYGKMDFTTRDRYRHVVEELAKGSPASEGEVARAAVELAQAGEAAHGGDDLTAHVGYYLVGDGLAQLERRIAVRLTAMQALGKFGRRQRLLLYVGGILAFSLLLGGSLTAKAYSDGLPGWLVWVVGLLSLLGASHLAVALVNWIATLIVTPRPLPRMDFSKGIPQQLRTLVVVPTLLTSARSIEDLVRALEVRCVANWDDHIQFALLTDFPDAPTETLPTDEPLLELARRRIEELNEKYRGSDGSTFFLFHRPRRWNAREGAWMGYERKRGKLADLNGLLRGGATDRFSLIVGDTKDLAGVKYVITLDTDTQLARDSARQFVGAMAHPLNRPRYDEERQRVVAGYGILQPRIGISLDGADRSRYSRICSSEVGIDPYTHAVSDVYQDVFAEGSFIGKGIYDVDAFERALAGRFPENRILSHDLLEGCYARAGLLSDLQLFEGYPSRYQADVSRQHRWIRGDWQIAQWALPLVPGPEGKLRRNPLPLLSRWKILDNLRRSLVPAALALLLLLSWFAMPSPLYWALAVVGIILFPFLTVSTLVTIQKPIDVKLAQHLASQSGSAQRQLVQAAFRFACLPYEAYFSLDAMFRACWRMLVSRRLLLQWNPSGEAERNSQADLGSAVRSMWIAPLLALVAAAVVAAERPAVLAVAGPILLLWFASPLVAWWISLPLARRRERLGADQLLFLRRIARKTWAYFETFVGPGDNWLPPDNYQEHPVEAVAHRTSPTNMGLALLANLTAYDFGFISGGRLIERTTQAFRTMEGLRRYQGHFFNWYDTLTLQPLPPLYISSVDSGNLAGHLLTLRMGLLGLVEQPVVEPRVFDGLSDALQIALEAAPSPAPQLLRLQQELAGVLRGPPANLLAVRQGLESLESSALAAAAAISAPGAESGSLLLTWLQAFARQCRDHLDELELLAPWTALSAAQISLDGLLDLDEVRSLGELAALDEKLAPALAQLRNSALTAAESDRLARLQELVAQGSRQAGERAAAIGALVEQCDSFARMEYDFLYDGTRHLLAIGYNVGESRRDPSYYDLLASEARFATFVAIAQGRLSQESWFALGRLLTTAGGDPILLSWSGSMFEYLMPLLVMPTYEHTLLDQTCKVAVARQIDYGRKHGVPWGVSESGYNAIDAHLNYQYRAFGVPGLGLKRGLADDLVIAPYASAMALVIAPAQACQNLERLSTEGFEARYGFYEAIDYTPARLPRGKTHAVVRSFMVHHQAMSMLSIAHLLLDRPIQRRFMADPKFQATLQLLQERIPKATAFYTHTTEISEIQLTLTAPEMPIRFFASPDTPNPEVQLLSNGRYHVMVTNAGGGYSRWRDFAVTRWREDRTCDNWGTFCYLRDVASGEFWSTAYQPALRRSKHFEAIFSEGRAEFRNRNLDYETHTEIAVSPEDDIELRRVRITNHGRTRRTVEITSYAEVVLASPAADALHPAFSNLFVQTEIIRRQRAIICTRRPRSQEEFTPWMLHLMAVHGAETQDISYETDRMKFIGRGNSVAQPLAMSGDAGNNQGRLSDSEGSVLDPIVAIRCRFELGPEESATVNIVSGIGETREAALNLLDKYQDRRLADRVFDLAWTHGQVLLRQFNTSEADAQLYGRLAGPIIYATSALRADANVLIKNRRGQSGLWGYAISGDLPIVLLQIENPANIDLVRQLVQAHAYWRLRGLAVDLVIWNEDHGGYRQQLHDQIVGLIAAYIEATVSDRPGGIFLRPADQIAEEDRILVQTVARAIISDSRGTLTEQLGSRGPYEAAVPALIPVRTNRPEPAPVAAAPRDDLAFYNSLGGFTADGREYVITTALGQLTPAPWVNVLANPQFGSVISESGMSYTWGENAHEFRLTPWGNDPVGDAGGEAFYIRDEERGHYWSPTPLPCRGLTPYVTRHGFGYTVFEHSERGISSEMWVYVAMDAPVKFAVLKLRNDSGRTRRLTATGYVEWVLGDLRPKTAMHVITEVDPQSGALLARNPYSTEFPKRTAFFDVDDNNRTVTGDRTEFLGRNGTLRAPAAMTRTRLSGRVGAALDPCGALQVSFELAPGQEREIVFRLGLGRDGADARAMVNRLRGPGTARSALDAVWQHWSHTLGAIYVETPDQACNVMANGWLLYQALACRLWGRSATYQSGGAFGFRDQLQDAMGLIHTRPELVREHLLRCAAHQFVEGDVQHWWHPPLERGVRTRCSDDYLWLPLAACRYVLATGDTGVLEESVPFLQGRPVGPDEDSYYDLPERAEERAVFYDHCVRALRYGLRFGRHGLPLIGTGDWNDGMNLVGEQGKGESIWLGFFLYEVLTRFAAVAELRGDLSFVEECGKEAERLRGNLETAGWDGAWYRRAYFDDGTPLGSSTNQECQIDSISQSWAVLSGAGEAGRARRAMEAVDSRLVRREQGLVKLLDPPFDKSALNPGYIKGYVPGVRENGGQYTHAAIWAAMAFALQGDSRRAWEIFSMINPVNHARSAAEMAVYKVEPYVVAADVYAAAPHTGRGGWTWYTGSAAWMYRLIIESLLGISLHVDQLHFAPHLPAEWEGFKLHYRFKETFYHITLQQTRDGGPMWVSVDGAEQPDRIVHLADDRQEHWVEVRAPALEPMAAAPPAV